MLDEFEHEQYLIVTNQNKQVMITGCSHNGIVNIIEKYVEICNGSIDKLACVIGGFHLFNPITRNYESNELISEIAEYLGGLNVKCYTCHCTGKKAYKILKDCMGEQLDYFSVGTMIEY
ncbi:MAG: hypothetical protein K2G45_00505 [Lachnospiraceae bacterium]|nr:hypothetical protein [Lachnospiraceae bacterium]